MTYMENFEQLRRTNTVLLTTRRKDGRTVDTPVNLAVDDAGHGYFRTWSTSGKARRLANFPGVRLAPCSPTGRPQGSDQPAVVTLLTGADADRARALLAKRFPLIHSLIVPWIHRLRGQQTLHYRVVPADEPTPWAG
ncbi:MAG: PPOX class F420-dependent oxidoreductase [Actinomycetota bacterium]|nr:PPOX class F420-dependent oxidoreductase [Actinomycetota bacterium]